METEYLNEIEDNHIGGEHLAPEIHNDFGDDFNFSEEDFSRLQGGEVIEDQEAAGNNVTPGNIDPRLAVTLLDTVLVAAFVLVLRYAGKDAKKSELKATEAEKRQLEPILQKCLSSVNWNIDNPWSALAVSALFIYGSKILVNWEDMEDRASDPERPANFGDHLNPEAFNAPKRKRGRPRKTA
jgi:hypothetical protein